MRDAHTVVDFLEDAEFDEDAFREDTIGEFPRAE